MHFSTKSYLKSTRNHIAKHDLKQTRLDHVFCLVKWYVDIVLATPCNIN